MATFRITLRIPATGDQVGEILDALDRTSCDPCGHKVLDRDLLLVYTIEADSRLDAEGLAARLCEGVFALTGHRATIWPVEALDLGPGMDL